jgi:hypothetical protein
VGVKTITVTSVSNPEVRAEFQVTVTDAAIERESAATAEIVGPTEVAFGGTCFYWVNVLPDQDANCGANWICDGYSSTSQFGPAAFAFTPNRKGQFTLAATCNIFDGGQMKYVNAELVINVI